MAQKTLNAFVVLGGRVDNTFGEIGTALITMGGTVDEVSQKLLNFGKESLNVYKDYEYNMTELETVWGTNGTFQKGSRALQSAMDDMKNMAADLANSNIFHTNDISNAMVEAAHAGWDYEQMLEGVPAAMAMAQAGGMDLSTAMNYVLKAQKSFGWSFDDITGKMDEWIYAANKSAGTTSEFGETFLKLGSTVRFAKNTEELLALTKVMHDMGTTGSAAGTMIKTSLMKLYAPSGKASKVLEQLGVSAQEIKDMGIMEDQGLLDALNTLEANGFSAFDSVTGQAKPVLQTYYELGQALIAISGYTQEADESTQQFYERVLKHQTVMGIMSEVFGIRGIQGSMNILMSLEEATQMFGDLSNNAAAGTTEYVREMMNNTLYGSTELFLSKVEELHRRTGEELAGDWQKIQGFVGGIVDSINTMDDDKFGAMVDGLKTIAVAGGGLIGAGSMMRFLGFLATVPGIIAMITVGAGAAVSTLNSLKEAKLEGMFGDMPLDAQTLNEYVVTLGKDFNTAFERVNNFAGALNTATENYKKASTTFSSDLLTAMLTKKEFTPEEKQAFEQMGIDIYEQVLASINASSDMAAEFWNALYGGDEVAAADPKYQRILELLNEGKDDAVAQAGSVAERLKAAMLEGFEEGFDEDDYDTILGMFEEYNALIARAQNQALTEEQFIQQEKWLHKAQTASLDDIQEMAKTVTEQRDSDLAELEDRYLTERARLKYYGATEEELSAPGGVDEQYKEWESQYRANYDEFLLTLWSSQTVQSGLGDAYSSLEKYADLYMSGQLSAGTVLDMLTQEMGGSKYSNSGSSDSNTRAMLGKIMGNMISSLGGEKAVASQVAYYEQTGNAEMAERMRHVLAMEQLVNGFSTILRTEKPVWDFFNWQDDFATTAQGVDALDAYNQQTTAAQNRAMMAALIGAPTYTLDMARNTISLFGGKDGLEPLFETMGEALAKGTGEGMNQYWGGVENKYAQEELWRIYSALDQRYDLSRVYDDMVAADKTGYLTEENPFSEWFSLYGLLYGEQSQNTTQYLRPGQTEAEKNTSGYTIDGASDAAQNAYNKAQGTLDELGDVSSRIDVTGGADAASAAHNAAQEWATQHPVNFAAKLIGSAFSGLFMAEGGRATEPAVFGEGPVPEWFIPERHTHETAKLILQSAQASGFSLPELAEIAGARMFAEGGSTEESELPFMRETGGRQTKLSIFAEAGVPEWFIPERHTQQTAKLILQSAQASGFSLPELAEIAGARMFAEGGTTGTALQWSTLSESSSSGSGSSDSGGTGGGGSIQVQYSPVIHADNASGVEKALKEDKKRFEKWINEWWANRQLYESMVMYQ